MAKRKNDFNVNLSSRVKSTNQNYGEITTITITITITTTETLPVV